MFTRQRLSFILERIGDRPLATLAELLLIGVVVYAVLRMLQGTRGTRLVRAVMIIMALSFIIVWLIADNLELSRINVLYPYFMLGVFLASLVAFQTELRRILAKVGEGGWLQRWVRAEEVHVEPIFAAVQKLSKEKTGAIIAIERSMEMAPWLETGVRIDGLLTADLLEAIFWPNSPLHDMGVIVRQDRILAARCQFPLAETGIIAPSLGSRHRAAVGLSQEADAIVIVVSEETGTVSVAIGGQLKRRVSMTSLRTTVLKELAAPKLTKEDAAKPSAVQPEPPEPKTTESEVAEPGKQDGTGEAA